MMMMVMKSLTVVAILVVSISLSSGAATTEEEFGKLAGIYQPISDVRDHAVIDLDHKLIGTLLQNAKLEEAKRVYQKGTYSRSYAEINFGYQGLPKDMAPHSPVTGVTNEGNEINGMLLEHGKVGDKSVHILYNNFENNLTCYVGGNPEPVYDGCFSAAGQMMFHDADNKAVPFSYNQFMNNKNDRVLAWFSTKAQNKMRPCPKCDLYNHFARDYSFYGKHDYAHRWIMAALVGTRTVFDSSTADFKAFSLESRAEAAKLAMVVMELNPYIIRELEDAVNKCKAIDMVKAAHAVDAAAAFYTGSLEDGSGSGVFGYSIANENCKHFKTCGAHGDKTAGTAKVNLEIVAELQGMQRNVTKRACSDGRKRKDAVSRKIIVPLIQGTLRYAYKKKNHNDDDLTGIDVVRGAAYAASIVPMIASCNYRDAEIIGDNMETTFTKTDFKLVKETFEKHYSCLGVKCAEVGGYWNPGKKKYYAGASPCTFDEDKESEQSALEAKAAAKRKRKHHIAWVGFPLLAVAIMVLRRRGSKKERRKRWDDDDSEGSFDSDFDVQFV